jgi:hypothetical protein
MESNLNVTYDDYDHEVDSDIDSEAEFVNPVDKKLENKQLKGKEYKDYEEFDYDPILADLF